MKLVMRQRIRGIVFTEAYNRPIKIHLEKGSALILDNKTDSENYGIHRDYPASLVGKELICVLGSKGLPEDDQIKPEDENIQTILRPEADHLAIVSIREIKTVTTIRPTGQPPFKHRETVREMKLATVWRQTGHWDTNPCPFFELTVTLSAWQYWRCKLLPVNTGFKIESIKIA